MCSKSTSAQIQSLGKEHYSGTLAIAEELPEWFDETARSESISTDIRHQEGFVAASEQRGVGFVPLYVAEGWLHIGWLGADKGSVSERMTSSVLSSVDLAKSFIHLSLRD